MGDVSVRRATKARHDALLALLRNGVDGVDTLAERLAVSPSTVRRDLTTLQREGRIARTYGGALVRDVFQERSFSESAQINQEAKAEIAGVAAELVLDGATIFLDAGTTCLALARSLSSRTSLTVVTRGLEAASLLARSSDIDVVMLGGLVRPLSHGLVGPLSSLALDRLSFDVAFLGADAVDPDKGLGEPTPEETYVKELAAARAAEVVLLADASKLGPAQLPAWIPLAPSWRLVTDGRASEEMLGLFEAKGVSVIRAGS